MKPAQPAAGDRARVSVTVCVPPETAWTLFSTEIDRWWRRGPKFRHAGTRGGFIHIEPRVGGRLFESIDDEGGERVFEVGRVGVWEPPHRLAFSRRNANFTGHETTEVDVAFAAVPAGTMVTVTHRGWSALRGDHPARHGLAGAAFSRMIGLWWGEQMSALRELSVARAPDEPA